MTPSDGTEEISVEDATGDAGLESLAEPALQPVSRNPRQAMAAASRRPPFRCTRSNVVRGHSLLHTLRCTLTNGPAECSEDSE